MNLPPQLGPYKILGCVGSGGMGEVYQARDSRLGRDVAIKVLPKTLSQDSARLRRFEQEAKTLAALNHPNVLSIFDTGRTIPHDRGLGTILQYHDDGRFAVRIIAGARPFGLPRIHGARYSPRYAGTRFSPTHSVAIANRWPL